MVDAHITVTCAVEGKSPQGFADLSQELSRTISSLTPNDLCLDGNPLEGRALAALGLWQSNALEDSWASGAELAGVEPGGEQALAKQEAFNWSVEGEVRTRWPHDAPLSAPANPVAFFHDNGVDQVSDITMQRVLEKLLQNNPEAASGGERKEYATAKARYWKMTRSICSIMSASLRPDGSGRCKDDKLRGLSEDPSFCQLWIEASSLPGGTNAAD